jgi:hypothetical protein
MCLSLACRLIQKIPLLASRLRGGLALGGFSSPIEDLPGVRNLPMRKRVPLQVCLALTLRLYKTLDKNL